MKLPMLGPDEVLGEIRRLYFQTSKQTIDGDLQRALELLKSMPNEEQRERATVYMEGLAEMYKDWRRSPAAGRRPAVKGGRPAKKR